MDEAPPAPPAALGPSPPFAGAGVVLPDDELAPAGTIVGNSEDIDVDKRKRERGTEEEWSGLWLEGEIFGSIWKSQELSLDREESPGLCARRAKGGKGEDPQPRNTRLRGERRSNHLGPTRSIVVQAKFKSIASDLSPDVALHRH